ncbi:hypothetical protein MGYG_07159 [Nannizzia gypsea CBS 118893]|uniref:Uncharacterized protein n=1 Tax=Arthroderma gypseum (strain ATCC MYA-4604 / CBS 118893) TaxID=535722 RepID=E4V287_ARTGP|nr:hypothetical protein MGYG_07159 [Nannizzia gypsea CBS 118893]EFR04152.1 hypothetical protein MGYG_07159 [Nannizzia gypsea CBS 118893]
MSAYRGMPMAGPGGMQYHPNVQPIPLQPVPLQRLPMQPPGSGPIQQSRPQPQSQTQIQPHTQSQIRVEDIDAFESEIEYLKEQLEHSELQRECIQNKLNTARAQERHDHEMIEGLQARIKELEEMLQRHGIEEDNKSSSMALVPASSCDTEGYTGPGSGNRNGSSLRRMSMQEHPELSPTTRYQNVFGQPPPRFNLPAAASTTANARPNGTQAGVGSQSHFASTNSNVNSATGTGTGATSESRGMSSSPEEQVASFVSMVNMQPQQAIHIRDPAYTSSDFSNRLVGLWTASKCFAMKYTNTAFMYDEKKVSEELRSFLNHASNNATELLSNVSTRFLMVSKIINWFITKTVLKTTVVSGFDPAVDSEIKQMVTHVNPGTPCTVKNAMIQGIGNHILLLRNRPLFDNFFNKRTHENTQKLFELLTPLIFSRDQNVWCDLVELMIDAHSLALIMYSGPYEFKFMHPLSHHNFDPTYMTDHNAGTDEDWAMQQAKRKYTVKLAITPVPLFKNVVLHPYAAVQVLHLGDMLLGPELGRE